MKRNWIGLLTCSLSLLVLLFAILKSSGSSSFIEQIKTFNKVWLFASILLILGYWFCEAMTMHILIRARSKTIKFTESFYIAMIGLLYGALTPFASGGQPMQIVEMNKSGIHTGDGGSIILIKAIIYQVALTFFGVIGAIVCQDLFNGKKGLGWWMVLFGFALNIVIIFVMMLIYVKLNFTKLICKWIILILSKINIIKNKGKTIEAAYAQVDAFNQSVSGYVHYKKEIFFSCIFMALQLLFYYAIPYTIYRGFGLSGQTLLYMIGTGALIVLITAFVPTPGGSGVAEGDFFIFFKVAFAGVVLPATLIWRVVTYYLCIICGGILSIFVLYLDRKKRRVAFNEQ